MKTATEFKNYTIYDEYISIETNAFTHRIYFLTEDILRIRTSFDGSFTEGSYALTLTAWADRYDALLKHERKRLEPLKPAVRDDEKLLVFSAGHLELWVKKSPFALGVKNEKGELLYKDLEGRAMRNDHLGRRFHYFEIDKTDCFYGLGENTGSLNKAGKVVSLAPKDAIGYDPEFATNMYKHIPFFIKYSPKSAGASGYFYNNFWNSRFNFGAEVSGYWPAYGYFETDGGDIDLFVINGPKIEDVVKRYTDLTGKSIFMPLYSLGYLGSTMYYVELEKNCDQEIIDFIEQNLDLDIPVDGFQLSSGYTVGDDGKRYVFHWNYTRFPEPKTWFASMNNLGVMVSPNVKPGILLTHPKYDDFLKNDSFIQRADGKEPYIGKWWGGEGSFVDFSNPSARNFWKKELQEQLLSKGTSSIWNDNCEYEIEDPKAQCCAENYKEDAGAIRSFLPNLMSLTALQAIEETCKEERPYVICRSGASGIQRYAQTWCGDNPTSWRTLRHNIATILNMGLSGVANQGADIGGFQGKRPNAELLLRWVQNGIFMPRFSIHSCNTDNTVTEPWMYEKEFEYIRKAILLRYLHIPYLYSLLKYASEQGMPIMRPLIYDFQEDDNLIHESCDFMFGPFMLISNILFEGETEHTTYLPKGVKWYDYSSRNMYEGGTTVIQKVGLSDIPIFMTEGAIIPTSHDLKRLQKDVMHKANILIIPGKESHFSWYQDDGKTNRYKEGDYLKTHIRLNGSKEKTVINLQHEGNYHSPLKELQLEVFSLDKGAYWVEINGERIPQILDPKKYAKASLAWRYDATMKAVMLKYPYTQQNSQIVISFEPFDLIGMSDDESDF